MAKLLRTDGSVTDVTPANGRKTFTLEELQSYVGGYIELISVGDRTLVIDEEGKLKGKPVNSCAAERVHGYIFADDFIVGDAVLCESHEIE